VAEALPRHAQPAALAHPRFAEDESDDLCSKLLLAHCSC
jgi:hypothetical protein